MKKTYLKLPDGSEVEMKSFDIPLDSDNDSDLWNTVISKNVFTIGFPDNKKIDLPEDFILLIAQRFEMMGKHEEAEHYRNEHERFMEYLHENIK